MSNKNQGRLLFAGREVPIKWSRRRRTIGLTVTAKGEVIISAPQGSSPDLLRKALHQHRDWLERKVAARTESWARLQQGAVYFLGQTYRLALDPAAKGPVALGPGEMRVRAATPAVAWGLLLAWYYQEAERLIKERVEHFAGAMDLRVRRVELRQWRRRWGECRPQEDLRFNWRLILVPPAVLDYVVVHELTHLKEPGHTPRFWQGVARVLPDYRERRSWLNRYGTPFLLWSLSEAES
ncbi:MAG: SprT family zinc-dependent metalloprotease [Syntrophales bacterium]|nr:SprT family zinc-dependent metalloprotease [Syntrophales bacterium]MDD5640066.1 SprT family zinc-dependent metalloprotease [Syntrophales bacterium]